PHTTAAGTQLGGSQQSEEKKSSLASKEALHIILNNLEQCVDLLYKTSTRMFTCFISFSCASHITNHYVRLSSRYYGTLSPLSHSRPQRLSLRLPSRHTTYTTPTRQNRSMLSLTL